MSSTMMDVSAAMMGTLPTAPLAGADGELLPIADLLQLLEQNADAPTGFSQALLTAGAVTAEPAPRDATQDVATDAPADDAADDVADDAASPVPCDIATLLRLLESRPPVPQPAQSCPLPIVTASGGDFSHEDEDGDASSTATTIILPTVIPAVPSPDPGDVPVDDTQASASQRPTAQSVQNPTGHGDVPVAAATHAAVDPALIDGPLVEAAAIEAAVRVMTTGTELPAREAEDSARPVDLARPVDALQSMHGLLQGLKPAALSMAGASALPERLVQVPMRDPAWPQAVAAEIRFLVDHKIDVATLRLNPEHLGPVEVRIDVRDERVSVSFGVHHGDTQAALEQSLPRLREMFAAAGLHLGDASVRQEARRDSQSSGAALAATRSEPDREGEVAAGTTRSLGLVDEYA
jgi:flagellar hook-length control protein FliK